MLTEEQIQEFETQHKRVARVAARGGEWECVYRKPSRAEYKRFRSMSNNPAQVADATEMLARACCVHPTREAFDALLEEWPGIPEASGKALGELAGFATEESGK